MSTHYNNVAQSVSGVPGTGTITLGSAVTGSQTIGAAAGGNATVDVFITDGGAWEVARNCTYTHSGTTLTRGTLEASSTGSALSLTSSAVVRVAASADSGRRWDAAALEQSDVTGTSGAISAEVNRLYVADMSGWTADRTLTLPATAAVGDRVGVMVSVGDDAYEWLVTAASGDTLNAVAGGTEWSRVFITGETVVFRCVTANVTWVVEYDGRKFESCRIDTNGTTAVHTKDSATKISAELATETSDVHAIWDSANKRLIPRRLGKYLIHGHLQMALIADGQVTVAQIYKNAATNIGGGSSVYSAAAAQYPEADVLLFYDVTTVGDYFELFVFYQDASTNRSTNNANIYFEATRIGDTK